MAPPPSVSKSFAAAADRFDSDEGIGENIQVMNRDVLILMAVVVE